MRNDSEVCCFVSEASKRNMRRMEMKREQRKEAKLINKHVSPPVLVHKSMGARMES